MWTREVAFSLLPLAVLNAVLVTACLVYLILLKTGHIKVEKYRDVNHRATAVLGNFFRDYWHWLTYPIERALITMRATPNVITFFGLLFSIAAGVAFYFGMMGTGGYMVILAGCCDIFDGRVARRTGQMTRSGAFFDSVLDRAGDGAIFGGIVLYFQDALLLQVIAIVGLISSQLISYTKSRAEAGGAKCSAGLMQRPERMFLLSITSLFDPLVKAAGTEYLGLPPVHYLFIGAVVVITVLSAYTVVQRLVAGFRAFAEMDREDAREAEAAGQVVEQEARP